MLRCSAFSSRSLATARSASSSFCAVPPLAEASVCTRARLAASSVRASWAASLDACNHVSSVGNVLAVEPCCYKAPHAGPCGAPEVTDFIPLPARRDEGHVHCNHGLQLARKALGNAMQFFMNVQKSGTDGQLLCLTCSSCQNVSQIVIHNSGGAQKE